MNTPSWKKWNFNNAHARKMQRCNSHEGNSPCGMQLAHQGLLNTKNIKKMQRHFWRHAQHLQERYLYGGKSPCGMQRARQELVKINPDKTQPKIQDHLSKFKQNMEQSKSLKLSRLWGLRKFTHFFQVGCRIATVLLSGANNLATFKFGGS